MLSTNFLLALSNRSLISFIISSSSSMLSGDLGPAALISSGVLLLASSTASRMALDMNSSMSGSPIAAPASPRWDGLYVSRSSAAAPDPPIPSASSRTFPKPIPEADGGGAESALPAPISPKTEEYIPSSPSFSSSDIMSFIIATSSSGEPSKLINPTSDAPSPPPPPSSMEDRASSAAKASFIPSLLSSSSSPRSPPLLAKRAPAPPPGMRLCMKAARTPGNTPQRPEGGTNAADDSVGSKAARRTAGIAEGGIALFLKFPL
mmetsp:Transcript_2563/g.6672  ORF Transcript_2563/g.6672 Transcript_2563/m.6672 type:complete len:263 (-) Transcript_2563:202-990(-)